MQLIEKSRYDSDDEEWIIPFVKKTNTDERLPGINLGGNNNNGGDNSTGSRSNSARPESGSGRRRNNNKNSRGGQGEIIDMYAQEKESTISLRQQVDQKEIKYEDNSNVNENVPTLLIPRHAPSKPPIAKNSARRQEKKKNKPDHQKDLVSKLE